MSGGDHIGRLEARLAAARTSEFAWAPGCWDGLSALLVERAGFDLAFLTGGGLSMARLGRPDVGLITASEACDAVAAIRDRVDLPLIADGDTGFGNAENVRRTVRMFERAGASAIQIEDQTFPKRCGHMAGKSVVGPAEAVDRIKAAVDARVRMLVVGRTDALAIEGFDATLERAQAFREAGADLIFVEGLASLDQFERVSREIGDHTPLVHNMVAAGPRAGEVAEALRRFGFAVALHPLLLVQALVAAAPALLACLARGEPLPPDLPTLHDLDVLLGPKPGAADAG